MPLLKGPTVVSRHRSAVSMATIGVLDWDWTSFTLRKASEGLLFLIFKAHFKMEAHTLGSSEVNPP